MKKMCLDRCPEAGLLMLRLTVGGLMLIHGVNKALNGIGFIEGLIANIGLPTFFAYGVFIGEIIAPLLILIGFRARLAALVLAFNMVVAVGLVHLGELFKIGEQGGYALELQAFYLFGALAIFFTGAGKLAVSIKSKWD